jgi:hypothetical protein
MPLQHHLRRPHYVPISDSGKNFSLSGLSRGFSQTHIENIIEIRHSPSKNIVEISVTAATAKGIAHAVNWNNMYQIEMNQLTLSVPN